MIIKELQQAQVTLLLRMRIALHAFILILFLSQTSLDSKSVDTVLLCIYAICMVVFSGLSAMLYSRQIQQQGRPEEWFVWSQLVFDVVSISLFVEMSQSPLALYVPVYLFAILAGWIFRPSNGGYISSSFASVCFFIAQFSEFLQRPHQTDEGLLSVFLSCLLHAVAFSIVAWIADIALSFGKRIRIELERAETQLSELEVYYQQLVRALPVGLILLRDEQLINLNPVASRLFENLADREREQLTEQCIRLESTAALAKTAQIFHSGEQFFQLDILEIQRTTQAADERIVLITEITETIRFEQLKKEALRLEIHESLYHILSHEFRNHLTVISGSAHVLQNALVYSQDVEEKTVILLKKSQLETLLQSISVETCSISGKLEDFIIYTKTTDSPVETLELPNFCRRVAVSTFQRQLARVPAEQLSLTNTEDALFQVAGAGEIIEEPSALAIAFEKVFLRLLRIQQAQLSAETIRIQVNGSRIRLCLKKNMPTVSLRHSRYSKLETVILDNFAEKYGWRSSLRDTEDEFSSILEKPQE